jgi:hypothetical protein
MTAASYGHAGVSGLAALKSRTLVVPYDIIYDLTLSFTVSDIIYDIIFSMISKIL